MVKTGSLIVSAFFCFMVSIVNETNAQEWWKGGKLHKSNGHEWKQSTYRNKLATVSDFTAKVWEKRWGGQLSSMELLLERSLEMYACINATFTDNPADSQQVRKGVADQKVSSIAASCAILIWPTLFAD